MRKIDPAVLEKLVEDILSDAIKSSKLVERIMESINDMDSDVIAYKNYDFTCPHCGEHTSVEEVVNDVTLVSVITEIGVDEDGELLIDYGAIGTESGDSAEVIYQCTMCGGIVDKDLMYKLAGRIAV